MQHQKHYEQPTPLWSVIPSNGTKTHRSSFLLPATHLYESHPATLAGCQALPQSSQTHNMLSHNKYIIIASSWMLSTYNQYEDWNEKCMVPYNRGIRLPEVSGRYFSRGESLVRCACWKKKEHMNRLLGWVHSLLVMINV